MLKTAEFVSLGHPDKIADYISSYILDRCLEQDRDVRYAVEVMIKGNTVVLGGEICGQIKFENFDEYVRSALCEIGYTPQYAQRWQDQAVNPDRLQIINLIGEQSCEISKGVTGGGWGDQGIFIGYACQGADFLPPELYLAKKLAHALYQHALNSDNLGLDIKTQITLDDCGKINNAVVAVPMRRKQDLSSLIADILGQEPQQLTINGTGLYTCHSSVADCGITGRKLACDFYAAACPFGGGSPWGKDATKADVSLNLLARQLSVKNLADNDEAFVYLSSCIGKAELPSATLKTIKNQKICEQNLSGDFSPAGVIDRLGLREPVFTMLCRHGLT